MIAGRAPLADAVLHHPEGGFDILAGRSGSGALSALDPATLERMLAALRQEAARATTSCCSTSAPGWSGRSGAWRPAADTLLVVATEEPTSLTDAYAVLKLHAPDRPDGEARVVVNQAATRAGRRAHLRDAARACPTFLGRCARRCAGVIRRDDRCATRSAGRRCC